MPFVRGSLVLVTGAGASRELGHPDMPLPLMTDWAQRLRKDIGEPLSAMTGLAAAETGPDFEETLGALFRWLEALELSEKFASMVKPGPSADEGHPQQFRAFLAQARTNGEDFQERLHRSLFSEFGPERVDAGRAAAAYGALFDALGFELDGGAPGHLICATTNYDRSLEIALAELGSAPRTGVTPSAFRTPVLDPVGLGTFGPRPGALYLHGAVGWYRDEQGRIISRPADEGYNPTLGRPAVLYPGPDKDIGRAETRALWDEFSSALAQATHVLVLGHALNDDHLVKELCNSDARLATTYLLQKDPTEPAAQTETRIRERLPRSTPIACSFGPELAIDQASVKKWAGASKPQG